MYMYHTVKSRTNLFVLVCYIRFTYKSSTMEEVFLKKITTIRKDIRVPETLVKKIEEYQIEKGVQTWTGALLELARKGLESEKK